MERPRRASAPPATPEERARLAELRAHALERGVNPWLYWPARAAVVLVSRLLFGMERIGRGLIPSSGPVIVASNHRSFLDPFIIGTLTRRPVYYMAKRELFRHRLVAWVLGSLGAFPVERGAGDEGAMAAAREVLERDGIVVIFPEGTRVRPGPLGAPRRGVGRLALETGACVVPVAVIGTEDIRRGWRIRPRHVRVRVGRPLRFPSVPQSTPRLAGAVTDRVWACVLLQWDWLGGEMPERPAPARPPLAAARARGPSAAGNVRGRAA